MRTLSILALAGLLCSLAPGQVAAANSSASAPPAAEVMSKAQAEAGRTNKNVWVIFHASWCGWCKELDKFIAVEANKKILEKHFVIVHLTVMESSENKALENAGGMDVLSSLKGQDQGIPFHAFVDKNGKMIENSRRKTEADKVGSNIGHPMTAEEVGWFMEMLKKGAPKMTQEERATLETWLKNQKVGG